MIRNSRLVKPSNEFVIFAEFNVTFKYLILGLHCSWWRWRRIWFCFTWTKFCYKKIPNDFETSQICGQIIGSFWVISGKLSDLQRNVILFQKLVWPSVKTSLKAFSHQRRAKPFNTLRSKRQILSKKNMSKIFILQIKFDTEF